MLRTSFVVMCGLWFGAYSPQLQGADNQIVGGEPVDDSITDVRRTATVALTTDYLKEGQDTSTLDQNHSFCSATVVSPYAVVTAAHCLQAIDQESRTKKDHLVLPSVKDFIIAIGNQVSPQGILRRAGKVVPHPDWNVKQTLTTKPMFAPHDIGVVVFTEPLEGVEVATIADPNLELLGLEAELVGFGVTKSRNENDTGIKRYVVVPIKQVDQKGQRINVGAFMKGACAGDSGGPAYLLTDDGYQLIGAASIGAEFLGQCLGFMNLYTDVRLYRDWIESVIAEPLH